MSRIVPAAASSSLFSPFKRTSLLVSQRLDQYVAPELAEPGEMLPVVRHRFGEIRTEFMRWDTAARDERGNCGFVDGFRKSIAFRCAVPIQSIVYPRGNVSEELFTASILAKVPTLLWVAGRINTDKNGVETVSLITAPSDERNAATSEHEPVLIDGVFLPTWFDVTVDAHLLLRSPTALRGTNPLFKAA